MQTARLRQTGHIRDPHCLSTSPDATSSGPLIDIWFKLIKSLMTRKTHRKKSIISPYLMQARG